MQMKMSLLTRNWELDVLIYQLPIPLCEMFIKEVFGDYDPSTLDEEISDNGISVHGK